LIKYQSIIRSLVSDVITNPIIDLGAHGFADSFFNKNMVSEASVTAPLICRLDNYSGLVQVENLTFADDRYNYVDYAYTSSNSQISRDHWYEFITSVDNRKKLNSSKVLEIGSNDGFLLGLAKAYTKNVVGIDASDYMVNMANRSGIKTIKGIFGESPEVIESLKKEYNNFDFIFANNVVNHSNNPIKFISDITRLISNDGILVFEVPYWLETIKTYRFDQIYHEHITYFSIESAEFLLNKCGLHINDVQVVDYHGGSLRIYASLNNARSKAMDDLLEIEKGFKLKEESTYVEYSSKIIKIKDNFLEKIEQKNYKCIFGIGAAAKANTFLTYYGFNQKSMGFILDSSPFKQGKITPVTKIPIVADNFVSTLNEGTGIVLAWNLGASLKTKLLSINSNLEFIDTFGKVN
jgi:2-polyprenyl-3-methyl-5-hydroxy-6-metoxy-1,4-benzoquinol methylase